MAKQYFPGSTLGVLGGGQLGRMFCVAGRTAGYGLVVLDPDPESPAGKLADRHIQTSYTDKKGLDELARSCDVITTEFENVPADSLRYLAQSKPVFPSATVLEIAQNRNQEKLFAKKTGLMPVPFCVIKDGSGVNKAIQEVGVPAILKTTTLGYDGKGQYVINHADELEKVYESLQGAECVLEAKIELEKEISVLVARNSKGTAVFPVAENEHRQGILHMSIVPARVSEKLVEEARQQAMDLAQALDYTGVLAVEFFISKQGELFFNEMAPRPHNSGHYTKDACVTSQFDQQVRMMCGLNPGDSRLISPVVMVNLLGDLWEPNWDRLLCHPEIKLHLYGKKQARPGRKMGHFNVLSSDIERAITLARQVFEELKN